MSSSSSQPSSSSSQPPPSSSSSQPSSSSSQPPSSSSSSHPSSSSSQHPSSSSSSSSNSSSSSSSTSSSSSSSSSAGTIEFTQGLVELFNPEASDYGWSQVGISNTTGKTIESVEFSPTGAAAFRGTAAAGKFGDAPLTLEATIPNPSTVDLRAVFWGAETKYGKASASFSAAFKDSNGDVIGTASIDIEAKATLRASLEESEEEARFNPEFKVAMTSPFAATTADLQLTNPDAPEKVVLAISDKIANEDAAFKAAVSAVILGLDNISVNRIEGTAGIEFTLIETTTVGVSAFGDYQAAFSPGSTPSTQFSFGGGVIFKSLTSDGALFDLDNIQIGIEDNKNNPPGEFNLQLQMSGGKSTFKLKYNINH